MFFDNHFQELLAASNAGVKETRLKNLQSIAEDRRWKPADFVREVGKSPSYWSDMLRGAKGFGEAVAREIEDKLSLPRFWLDEDHERGEALPRPAHDNLALAVDGLARAIAKLSKLDRRQLAALLPLLAEEPESRQDTCAAIMRLLEPSQKYEYVSTWEEAAEEVAAELGPKKLTARELVDWVAKARAKAVQPVSTASTVKASRTGT